ncbi:MAG: potassium channel family protein [Lachnospiraceae bacterium]|jgi:voltage-gated potassium channel|nr:potassium channel family protein [Lachnospiraceae bacterium]
MSDINIDEKKFIVNIVDIFIAVLAIISIALVILDYTNVIVITTFPWIYIDRGILIIFAIDYFTRLYKAKNKMVFFKHNIFDLLAIIPFNSLFSIFRFSRLFRLARLSRVLKFARLLRIVGVSGKLINRLKEFLNTNGFIYLLYTSGTLIFISSIFYSMFEKVSFSKALWWSIVTTTTVGYGDISPRTNAGKVLAVILMILGIALVGMLTSTIVSFFSKKHGNSTDSQIDEIKNQIEILNEKMDRLLEDKEQKIFPDFSSDHFYSEENISYLKEGVREFDKGKGVTHSLEEMEEALTR